MRMKGIDMRNDLTKILGNVTQQHVLTKKETCGILQTRTTQF